MTTAVALSKITGETISTAALVGITDGRMVFTCTPKQRLTVKITNRMLEIRSDRRPEALFVARFLYEPEAKCLLRAAECGRNEVLT